jgi:hypothetical protein
MKTISVEIATIIPKRQLEFTKQHLDEYSDVIERLEKQLEKCPKLYETEKMKEHQAIFHYFCGKTDIYICEYEPKDCLMFGFSILNGDLHNAEWGYINISEIISIPIMNIDYHLEEQSIEMALYKKYPKHFNKPSSLNFSKKEKCVHDYLRIITGIKEGDYECTHCGDIKTQQQLRDAGESWSD